MLILLVEDNPVVQQVESTLLQKLGHQVIIADRGQLALQLVSQHPFQLVLMDMELPDMSGIDTTRTMRSRGVRLPIVAITGNNTEGDKQACRNAGMNGFLTKPIKVDQIQAVIAKYA